MAGWASLLGMAFYLLYRTAHSVQQQEEHHLRFANVLAAASVVGAFATTAYFPWDKLVQVPVVGKMLDAIQFPYRLMILVSASTTVVAGYAVLLWLKKKESRRAACAGITLPRILSDNPSLTVSGWARAGTNMRFDYRMELGAEGENTIILPVAYIPKYEVCMNGQRVETSRTDTARIIFTAPAGEGDGDGALPGTGDLPGMRTGECAGVCGAAFA